MKGVNKNSVTFVRNTEYVKMISAQANVNSPYNVQKIN